MASRALTPWLTREWLSHRNLHGATLPAEPTLETKRLQLVTATGISNDPGDTLLWCEVTDGQCWIDCCIPTSLVDAFDSTTSLKFTASSASKCLFRAHSWRFVLASPLVPARSSPSKRHLSTQHQQRKSLRVCLRIERFDRHSTGDGHFAESFAFRDAAARDEGGDAGAKGSRGEADKQRAMWVRKVEQGALDGLGAAARAAPEVAYAANLPPDPARRTRPAPAPAPTRNRPLFPAASTSAAAAPPLVVAPAVSHKRPRPSWPADNTPVRLDWAAAASLLDRRASSSSATKRAAAVAARRASEARAAPPAPVQPSVKRPDAPAPAPSSAPAGAVALDWTAASSLLTSSSSARKRVKPSPGPDPAPSASTSTSTSAAASCPSAPVPAPARAPTAAVSLDWSAASSLLSSSARKRARPSLGAGSSSSASASSSSAAVLESNRALLDQEARAQARAQAQAQAQAHGSSPSETHPEPQPSAADAAKDAAALKRQKERVRLLATQLADLGGGGGAAARAAALKSARKASAGGRASTRGVGAAERIDGKAAGREGQTERPGERSDREAALRARDVRRASSGSRPRVERSTEGAARAATASGATTAAAASSSRALPPRTSSPPSAAPSPQPRQPSPALSIRSQASEPVDAPDEDVVMRDESSPVPPTRSPPSSAAFSLFQPRPVIEQRPSLPPSASNAAPLVARPHPPAPSPPRHASEPDPPLARAQIPPSPSAPAAADSQPQPQQPAMRRVVDPPTFASAPPPAQAAADDEGALAAQAAEREGGAQALSAQRRAHERDRRRGQQIEGVSSRVIEAQQARSAFSAGSSAAVRSPRGPQRAVATCALIPLEVWDFGAWLRSRGLEGFDVPHEDEDAGERAEVF